MTITIQNESKKIALSEPQLGSLSAAYKDFMTKQNINATSVNNGTNVDAVEQIVNQSSTVVPQEEPLITDSPVNQTAIDSSVVTPIVENPSVVIPEGPEVKQPVEGPTENDVASQTIVEQTQPIQEVTNNASQEVNLEELKKQLLEDYYDLQLHVQEVGVKLEEMLEKIKNLPLTKEQNITNTPAENITTPPAQEKTEQVIQTPTQEQPPMENMFNNKPEEPLVQNQAQSPVQNPIPENVNIFDQGVNIFDQVPQNPSNGGQLKI